MEGFLNEQMLLSIAEGMYDLPDWCEIIPKAERVVESWDAGAPGRNGESVYIFVREDHQKELDKLLGELVSIVENLAH